MTRHRKVKIRPGALLGVSFAVIVLGVSVSPVSMAWLSKQRTDWDRLAQVGEAYGGASAMLSGMAFCGIAVSLFLQWRQLNSSLLYAIKQRHFELVRLTLENPAFLYVDGPEVVADPNATLKVYGNLLVNHWSLAWDLGFMNEAALRESARRLFRTAIAREWWIRWGQSYLGAKERERFVEILAEECESAASILVEDESNPPEPSPERPAVDRVSPLLIGAVAGTLLGAAGYHMARRARRRSSR